MSIKRFDGDRGKTFLLNGKALSKAELVFDALGDLDELNSFFGIAKNYLKNKKFKKLIEGIQRDLFKISAKLAGAKNDSLNLLITNLDDNLMYCQKKVGSIHQFVIPGKLLVSANLDVCRAITRRAERNVSKLSKKKKLDQNIVIYLNHLSKFLFFFARMIDKR